MGARIEVGLLPEQRDVAGSSLLKKVRDELGMKSVSSIRVLDVFTLEDDFPPEALQKIGSQLFCDSIVQHFSINSPLVPSTKFAFAISIGFLPGVKDNVGDTSREAVEELLGTKLSGQVFTSRHYLLSGKPTRAECEKIASELSNPLIQRHEVKSSSEFGAEGFSQSPPKVLLEGGGKVEEISLDLPDKRLLDLSRQRLLALSLEEMKAIRDYYSEPGAAAKRKQEGLPPWPTDAELECIAQTWSEHCKHKIFNARITYRTGRKKKAINSIFKTYVKAVTQKLSRKKKWLVSVFSDNAGIMEFVPGYNIAMKVETHNTPSALDPYGGALTGILGVNRDVLGCGLGAKPIFNTDVFCFAPPAYHGSVPPRLFHPRRVLEGVRAGVATGGNASGIPTVNGSLVFDERYLGKPLVYCGTCGIMPSEINGRKTHIKGAMPSDRIFMAGGRIGKDGIHGATFSSEQLHEGSPVSAVQLGDPYTQKKLSDFLLEARDAGLFSAVTDNGAGGLSSSVGEMAQSSGGAILHLDRALLKYPGLHPWEILVSESQERMTFAVPPSKAGQFVQLARLRGVEISDMGQFTQSGYFTVMYGAKAVCSLEMEFLHNGLPQLELEAEYRPDKPLEAPSAKKEEFSQELHSLLSRPNICSKEYIIRQYDHEVQGSSVIKPLCGPSGEGPSDAGVVSPLLGRNEGVAVSNGICPRYSDLDCYQMAANAVDESVRNFVCVGGDLERMAALDNFCWPDPVQSPDNPDGKHKLAQLVETCRGLHDACMAYGMPLISGKDSMKNDYRHGKWKISIPPTLLVSTVGTVRDCARAVTSSFKSQGDAIYVAGETKDELGGSEYFSMKGCKGGAVPKVNFKKNLALYRKLQSAVERGLVASCHDCSEGGLSVALAECCIGGGIGATVDLSACAGKLTAEKALFSESSGRFVLSVKRKNEKALLRLMRGAAFVRLGETGGERLSITHGGKAVAADSVSALKASWKKTMDW